MIPLLQPLVEFLYSDSCDVAKEKWPKGPRSWYKDTAVPVTQYIEWIHELEQGPLRNDPAKKLVQRLRRLSYSSFTKEFKSAGPKFDMVISAITPYAEPPLTTDHLSVEALNGLFSTSVITTARGLTLDPSHIWAVADVILAGDAVGPVDDFFLDSKPEAILGWTGDLGAGVNDWVTAMGAGPGLSERVPPTEPSATLLLRHVAASASKEDILGDMDGVVLGHHWNDLDTFVISQELTSYYAGDALDQVAARQLNRPVSARRFHYFVRYVEPSIDASGKNSSPLAVTIPDVDSAADDVSDALADAVDDLIAVLGGANVTVSGAACINRAGQTDFDHFCRKFVAFLITGLATGDATWPPATLDP